MIIICHHLQIALNHFAFRMYSLWYLNETLETVISKEIIIFVNNLKVSR